MQKMELISLYRQSRAEWEVLVAPLKLEQLTQPMRRDEWTVKDVIAHLAWHEREMAVVIRSLDTGEEREFLSNLEFNRRWPMVRWFPDGRSLLFATRDNRGRGSLHRMDAQTGTVTPVLQSPSSASDVTINPPNGVTTDDADRQTSRSRPVSISYALMDEGSPSPRRE